MELNEAIKNGCSVEYLKKLLIEAGGDVNQRYPEMESPRILIFDDDFSFDDLPCKDDSPLHMAIRYGNYDVFKFLIENGADLEARNSDSFTPLHLSITRNQLQIFRDLVEAGADYNSRDDTNSTTLMLAAVAENSNFLKDLLAKGVDINAVNDRNETAICFSIGGNTENVKILLDSGANPNIRPEEYTLLTLACMLDRPEIATLLLKYGLDADGAALYSAVGINENAKITNMLLKCGAEIDLIIDGNNVMNSAAENLNKNIIESLVAAGAGINVKNDKGETPLDNALLGCIKKIKDEKFNNGHLNAFKYLLELSDNINICKYLDKMRNRTDCRQVIKLLIKVFLLKYPEEHLPTHIDFTVDLSDWWKDCQGEVLKMQHHLIARSHISLHTFLTNPDRVTDFVNNSFTGLRQDLENNRLWYRENFAIYHDMIEEYFSGGMKRGLLLAKWVDAAKQRNIRTSTSALLKIAKTLTEGNLEMDLNPNREDGVPPA